jgi:hypothetical protein
VVDPDKLAYAAHLRDSGSTIAEIVTKTGITRTSLYRHLPPRPPEPLTAAGTSEPPQRLNIEPELDRRRPDGNLESTTWPPGYAPACPTCRQPTTRPARNPGQSPRPNRHRHRRRRLPTPGRRARRRSTLSSSSAADIYVARVTDGLPALNRCSRGAGPGTAGDPADRG